MSDGVIELLYYAIGILNISIVSSFLSKKVGITVSVLISVISVVIAIGMGAMPIANYSRVLFLGIVLFPALAWFGLFLGSFFRKKQSN